MPETEYALGWLRGPERPEKWQYRLIPRETPDLTKPRSLAKYATTLFDQGNEGSCTANAGCLAAMMTAAISGAPTPVLSRMWKYYQERLEMGTFPQDSGAYVVDEYDTDKRPGEIADSVWSYDANPSERPPSATGSAQKYHPIAGYQPIAAGDFRDGILTALDNQQPVAIGFAVPQGMMSAWSQRGVWDTAALSGQIVGGHAVLIIGWVPPSNQFPQGAYLFQNSWGATSPDNGRIHSDCTPGRGLFTVDAFASLTAGAEADAVVGQTQPAILSVSIQAPASILAGQSAAFAATVAGAPQGTHLTYNWNFGDGTQGDGNAGATVSHIFAIAGSYTVTCHVSVATTGAAADGSIQVSVGAAPSPSNLKQEIDAAQNGLIAQLQQYASGDIGNMALYRYAEDVVAYDRDDLLDPLLSGNVPSRMAVPPRPRERN